MTVLKSPPILTREAGDIGNGYGSAADGEVYYNTSVCELFEFLFRD